VNAEQTPSRGVVPVAGLDIRQIGRGLERAAVYLALIAGGLVFAFPFYWMVRTSLLPLEQIFIDPPIWIPNPPRWYNYVEMWQQGPFWSWIKNSVIVTVLGVLGNTVTSAMAAYGFARTSFPGRDKLFLMVMATLMIPFHVLLIPQFAMFNEFGWLDTLYPLWVPSMFGSAFSIFILRQYFLTLPKELDDAAVIDGATKWDILWRIIVPLAKPALGTVAVFSFIGHWNEFVRPLVFLRTPDSLTLAVGIRWFTGRYETYFHWLMGGAVLALAPIIVVFFFVQKQFVQGIALTGLKG
jgi:multiple sugar transport system permease protein